MVNPDFIQKQISQLNELKSQNKQLNSIFEQTMAEALKTAPPEHKEQIIDAQNLAQKAFVLAKEGKVEEAVNLTNELKTKYTNGR